MKRILFLLIIIFLSSRVYSQSGWQRTFFYNANEITSISKIDSTNIIAFTYDNNTCLRSSNSGLDWITYKCFDTICTIHDSKFTDYNTGWCVGEKNDLSGIIYKTTNGGFNWTRIHLDTFFWGWWCSNFINSNTGWIGGYQDRIIKTTDGGRNWLVQNLIPSLTDIRGINFINYNTGWVCGRNRYVAKTTNSGVNWISQDLNIMNSGWNMSVCSIDSNNLWIIGDFIDSVSTLRSYVSKTTNGGINWIRLNSEDNVSSFLKISFLNNITGYEFGNRGYINKTTNGGDNWISINTGNYGSINSMVIKNENEIMAGGGSYSAPNNIVIETTNGGSNWNLLNSNIYHKFNDIYFADQNTGFFAGENGLIYRTYNGGNNWIKLNAEITDEIFSINFINNSTGFIFGANGKILRTSNQGDNWSLISSSFSGTLLSSYFIRQDTGWTVGYNNTILKTIDSGNNWIIQIAPLGPNISQHIFTSISFRNNLTGFVVGNWLFGIPPGIMQAGSTLLKTTNGGNNWIDIYGQWDIIFYKLTFLNNNTGYIAAQNNILKTTTEGLNWFSVYNNNIDFYDIKFVNDFTGYAVGKSHNDYGVIFKTTNEGLNWYQQFNEYHKGINRIFTLDTSYMWTAGLRNTIYKSTDGGGVISSVYNVENEIPSKYYLYQNYPNPFNPVTKIDFELPEVTKVKLTVYDIIGREILNLVNNELKTSGKYTVEFNGTDLPSGVYFYRLEAGDFVQTKRMVLVK